jgi:hypothetical protein
MVAINEHFQREVAPTLAGLERREAILGQDGKWVLVLRYSDMEHATGGRARDTSEVAQEFMSKIDMTSMSASFHPIVSECLSRFDSRLA